MQAKETNLGELLSTRQFASPWSKNGLQLLLLGFSTLFLELVLIRYLAGNIWNLGYFPNLVLLATFVGMGIGFLFHHFVSEKLSSSLFVSAFVLLLGLVTFVFSKHPTVPGFGRTQGNIGGELYFSWSPGQGDDLNYLFFLLCFVCIIVIFALISQRTAKLFRLFKPLTAYTLDIIGSCCGILFFMLISWLQLPAWQWFAMFTVIFVLAMAGSWKMRAVVIAFGIMTVSYAFEQDQVFMRVPALKGTLEVTWSPYQKIEYIDSPKMLPRYRRFIFANGLPHQRMENDATLQTLFYQKPFHYRSLKKELPPYRNIMILGAGTGNDAAIALQNQVERVDAVEIDPVIAYVGKEFHPSHPY